MICSSLEDPNFSLKKNCRKAPTPDWLAANSGMPFSYRICSHIRCCCRRGACCPGHAEIKIVMIALLFPLKIPAPFPVFATPHMIITLASPVMQGLKYVTDKRENRTSPMGFLQAHLWSTHQVSWGFSQTSIYSTICGGLCY
jgi:hypothetical protein